MGVAYYDNRTTLTGGSFCYVDTAKKKIISIEQGNSTTAPVNPSDLFQFIKHDGAFNTSGNFQNPGPIDQTQLLGNPDYALAPTFSVGPSAFTYIGSGSGSYDAEISFTFATGTGLALPTATPAWLGEIGLLAVPNGTHGATLTPPFTTGAIKGVVAPTSSAAYTVIFHGLSAGTAYDCYVYLIDIKSLPSEAALVATTATNPILVGNTGQQGYPGTDAAFAALHPVATVVTDVGVAPHDVTFLAEVVFTMDSNGYVSAGNQWLAEIQLWTVPHGTGNSPSYAGTVAPAASGNYTGIWGPLGNTNGAIYDLYVRLVDYKGRYSGLSTITGHTGVAYPLTQASAGGVGSTVFYANRWVVQTF
jgi:hypothetical protein